MVAPIHHQGGFCVEYAEAPGTSSPHESIHDTTVTESQNESDKFTHARIRGRANVVSLGRAN